MASMKIIHMSDLHIADKGKPIWDTDTLAHFDAALERIETEENIDAIFITGDIADNGSEWAYEYVDEAMARLGIPTYVCPGNHDWVPNMKNTLKFCQMQGWSKLEVGTSFFWIPQCLIQIFLLKTELEAI